MEVEVKEDGYDAKLEEREDEERKSQTGRPKKKKGDEEGKWEKEKEETKM